jgi:hypothetical protein
LLGEILEAGDVLLNPIGVGALLEEKHVVPGRRDSDAHVIVTRGRHRERVARVGQPVPKSLCLSTDDLGGG